jgi:hypothetical protein
MFKKWQLNWIGCFLLLPGLILIVGGIYNYSQVYHLEHSGIKVIGKVITSMAGSDSWIVEVRYPVKDDSLIVANIDGGSHNENIYPVGKLVEVRYDTSNPDNARIWGWKELYVPNYWCFLIGFFLSIAGILSFR